MKKYIVETYYTCTFKTVHTLDDLNDNELSKIDNRTDGNVEVIEVKLNNRKTKKIGGEKVDKSKISIKFGDFLLEENGSPVENINLEKIREYMKWYSILIEINLNLGSETFNCYTFDFTHDYIDINTDYRN